MQELNDYRDKFKINQLIWWVGNEKTHCLSQGRINSVTQDSITVILKPLLADNTESSDSDLWNTQKITNSNINQAFTKIQEAIDQAKVKYEIRLNKLQKMIEKEKISMSYLYSIERITNPPIDRELLIGNQNERRFYCVLLDNRKIESEQIYFYMSKGQAYQTQIKNKFPDFTDFIGYDDLNTFLKELSNRFKFLIDLYYDDYQNEEELSKNKFLVKFYNENFVPIYEDQQTKRMSILELIEQLS